MRAAAQDLHLAGGRMSGYAVDDTQRDRARARLAAAAPMLADVEVAFFETVRDEEPVDRVLAQFEEANERFLSAPDVAEGG